MGEDDQPESSRKRYPLTAFIEAIEAEGGMAGTQAVAEHVGCSYELAYKRLSELKENERIESERVGNAHLWKTM